MSVKKSPAQLQREIDEVLASPGSFSYEEAMAALEKKHAGVKRGGSLRAGHAPVTPAFEEAKAEGARLEKEVDAADVVLKAFPRSPLGGVSDAARATPEFRAANARFQRAFAALRAFNAVFTKRFAKELRAERDARARERERGR